MPGPMDQQDGVKAQSAVRRARWKVPAIAGAIYVGAYLVTELSESSFRYPAALALALLTTVILVLWFVSTSPWRRTTRISVAGLVAILLIALGASIRTEGWSGDMVPRLTWRWSNKPDVALAHSTEVQDLVSGERANLSATSSHDFPQFLGPDRDGKLGSVRLNRDWTANPPREMWRRPVGAGWSGFAVVGDYALTQEQRGPDELVVCYKLLTGEPVWAHAHPGVRFSETMGGDGPRATPTIVGGKVFALGATGILDCLAGEDGRVVWTRDIVKENGAEVPDWGKSGSPLVLDNGVIVSAGGKDGGSLVAYERDTGEVLWRGGSSRSSYSSPLLATLAGQPQVVIVNAKSVAAHDPQDGRVLWEYAWPGDFPKVTQPVPIDDARLLISAGYGVGSVLLTVDQSDGQLSVAEVWKSKSLKPKFTNLVTVDGHVYGLDEGILTCVDLEDGRRRWKKGRYGHGQLLLLGDLLLIQAESGDVVLVDPNPEQLTELTRFTALTSKTWNSPTVAGKYLLVRNDQEAACFELPVHE